MAFPSNVTGEMLGIKMALMHIESLKIREKFHIFSDSLLVLSRLADYCLDSMYDFYFRTDKLRKNDQNQQILLINQ